MKNADRIKKMTLDEMTEFLDELTDEPCNCCIYDDKRKATCERSARKCKEGILKWLQQDDENGLKKIDVIKKLLTVSSDARISCIIVCNGELVVYEQSELKGEDVLTLARAKKRGATIHITG